MTASPPENSPFRILSLDGGGIRGAFIASCLAEMEEHLELPLGRYFDLIAGTSTGGIIALALALGEPASRIRDLYRDEGASIFTRPTPLPVRGTALAVRLAVNRMGRKLGLDYDMLRRPKYGQERLRAALSGVYGERTLEEMGTRVLIPAVDLTRGQTVVFKTPHQPGFIRDRKYRALDVALATSAAPLYFPPASIEEGSRHVDGGVWNNNPSMSAYAEAVRISRDCRRPEDPTFTADDVLMLSIGTGQARLFAEPPEGRAGAAWWSANLLNLVTVSQAQGTVFQMRYVLDQRYHRIDFDMPDGTWGLDAVSRTPQLLHLGKEKAAEHFSAVREQFLTAPTAPYVPFER